VRVICARLAGSGLFRKEKKAKRRLRDLFVMVVLYNSGRGINRGEFVRMGFTSDLFSFPIKDPFLAICFVVAYHIRIYLFGGPYRSYGLGIPILA
jgi:hypothetical protein